MEVIVADTSALISLAISDIFKYSKLIYFKIPKEVYRELNLIKHYKDKDGNNAKRILKNLKAWNIEVLNVIEKQLFNNPLIDPGEAECLNLALENNISKIITDDMKSIPGLNDLSENRVSIYTSILIPAILYSAGVLSKKKVKQIIIQISKHRQWNDKLFRESMEFLE